MKKSFTISTPRKNCFIDITQQIGSFVSETGIESGQLVFGTWQGVYFCEFDGPRQRKFLIKVISG